MTSGEPDPGGTGDAEPAEVRAAVRAVREGERNAYARLVRMYQGRLYGLALMMVRDPTGAEEVAQAAFVRAYANLDRYDEHRPFYPWLSTIATRLAQSWLRDRGRRLEREGARYDPERSVGVAGPSGSGAASRDPGRSTADPGRSSPDPDSSASPRADPLAQTIASDEARRLWRAVEALSSGERTAVYLYYRQELKVREVAKALGVTDGTVKTLLFRARNHLREALDSDSHSTREEDT